MLKERNRLNYGTHLRRNSIIRWVAFAFVVLILAVTLIMTFVPAAAGWIEQPGNVRKTLLQLWEDGAYQEVFDLSKTELARKPLDYFLLTLHGFAAYQIGIVQINTYDTLIYIDECVWSLRKALLAKNGPADNQAGNGRVYYVLGKAYYYKGTGFADLAVKFLELARQEAYVALDIPEFLGVAYAGIHDFRNSVAAFTLALDPENGDPSDQLLLAIARSYGALEDEEGVASARAYLLRCIETSKDFRAVAEAYYQLGEILAAQGNTTGARAEWRRAIQTDPAHKQARLRLAVQ